MRGKFADKGGGQESKQNPDSRAQEVSERNTYLQRKSQSHFRMESFFPQFYREIHLFL